MQTWIRYAGFEEKQGELARARSVFERALDVDPRNVGIWMRYAEMEMRAKQVKIVDFEICFRFLIAKLFLLCTTDLPNCRICKLVMCLHVYFLKSSLFMANSLFTLFR